MEPTFITREEANTLVGTKVRDIELYRRAFNHKSALKVYNFETSNETLEFMGDSVLGFIITKFLFDKYESISFLVTLPSLPEPLIASSSD